MPAVSCPTQAPPIALPFDATAAARATKPSAHLLIDDQQVIRVAEGTLLPLLGLVASALVGCHALDALPMLRRRELRALRWMGHGEQAVSVEFMHAERMLHVEARRAYAVDGRAQLLVWALVVGDDAEAHRNLAEHQRLEALSHVAAGIAHELNTPAQFIADNAGFVRGATDDLCAFARMARDAVADAALSDAAVRMRIADGVSGFDLDFFTGELPPAFAAIEHGLTRITGVGRDVRAFVRAGRDTATTCDAGEEITLAIALCRRDLTVFGLVQRDVAPELPALMGRPGALCEVLVSIFMRLCDALRERRAAAPGPAAGELHVHAAQVDDRVEIVLTSPLIPSIPATAGEHEIPENFAIVRSLLREYHDGSLAVVGQGNQRQRITLALPFRRVGVGAS
jgi:signal transduction histidine kinase